MLASQEGLHKIIITTTTTTTTTRVLIIIGRTTGCRPIVIHERL